MSDYKPSRKAARLGLDRKVILSKRWQGGSYWLCGVGGAAEPPVPPRLAENGVVSKVSERAVLRLMARYRMPVSHGAVVKVSLGDPIKPKTDERIGWCRPIGLGTAAWSKLPFPLAANADFATHIERCHPKGEWVAIPNGSTFILGRLVSGRLRAVLMPIVLNAPTMREMLS